MATYKSLGNRSTVGPYTNEDGIENYDTGASDRLVFQPHQGRDTTVWYWSGASEGKASIIEERDSRVSLGTYTLNDRGLWEKIILNDTNTAPVVNPKSVDFDIETAAQTIFETPDGEIVQSVNPTNLEYYHNISVDALPYRIRRDKETNELVEVPLVLYHDKELHSEDYYASTEGKVNLQIFLKSSNRDTDNRNIRNYQTKYDRHWYIWNTARQIWNYTEEDGQRYRIKTPGGYYVLNLNWGDGTPEEHNSEPFQLGLNSVFEHTYEKPGFYTITGVVFYAIDITGKRSEVEGIKRGNCVFTWEKFETNMLINPSDDYEDGTYLMDNFCTIGGMSPNSAYYKNLIQNTGYNNTTGQSLSEQEEFNELDKINMLETLAKYDLNLLLEKDRELLNQYMMEREGILRDLSLEETLTADETGDLEYNFNKDIVGLEAYPQHESSLQPSTPHPVAEENDNGEVEIIWYYWSPIFNDAGDRETIVIQDEGEFPIFGWIEATNEAGDRGTIVETIMSPFEAANSGINEHNVYALHTEPDGTGEIDYIFNLQGQLNTPIYNQIDDGTLIPVTNFIIYPAGSYITLRGFAKDASPYQLPPAGEGNGGLTSPNRPEANYLPQGIQSYDDRGYTYDELITDNNGIWMYNTEGSSGVGDERFWVVEIQHRESGKQIYQVNFDEVGSGAGGETDYGEEPMIVFNYTVNENASDVGWQGEDDERVPSGPDGLGNLYDYEVDAVVGTGFEVTDGPTFTIGGNSAPNYHVSNWNVSGLILDLIHEEGGQDGINTRTYAISNENSDSGDEFDGAWIQSQRTVEVQVTYMADVPSIPPPARHTITLEGTLVTDVNGDSTNVNNLYLYPNPVGGGNEDVELSQWTYINGVQGPNQSEYFAGTNAVFNDEFFLDYRIQYGDNLNNITDEQLTLIEQYHGEGPYNSDFSPAGVRIKTVNNEVNNSIWDHWEIVEGNFNTDTFDIYEEGVQHITNITGPVRLRAIYTVAEV